MALPAIFETRRDQIFPELEPLEIERMRRFGEVRSFAAGEALAAAGHVSPGLMVILAGRVDVTQHDHLNHHEPIVTYEPGHFSANWRNWPAGRHWPMRWRASRSKR